MPKSQYPPLAKTEFNAWVDKEGVARLSRILGVNDNTIGYWKRGHCFPKREMLPRIASLSGLSIDQIFTDILKNRKFRAAGTARLAEASK